MCSIVNRQGGSLLEATYIHDILLSIILVILYANNYVENIMHGSSELVFKGKQLLSKICDVHLQST